ncbi:alpha-1B adrenergic receptor-like [Orbicella faveolata]|uniref:alpha-1B adrenergic receptor-like n=1 Tax=Orbicella faveolata TaxID=48498 RepID=UPI0009E2A76D|nr:alpha-1B adrenergic receptor-like [Orbicella faveolata]
MDDEALNVPLKVSYIITIIFNSITCPFIVVLNMLVIMAVKRKPRLQSYANVLLACLAVTDALTGLLVQPTFIIWGIFQLLGGINTDIVRPLHFFFLTVVTFSSALHLMLVTCERLIAIKYTMAYPYLVTARNIKVAVTSSWVLALCCSVLRWPLPNLLFNERLGRNIGKMIVSIVLISCIVFMTTSYTILYKEAAHQQSKIKAQQLPQEEVERFVKERKALKTTVYVVGAVLLCLSPGALSFVPVIAEQDTTYLAPWFRMIVMLNSLLNPLIYCWRQKEMRQFVFRMSSPAVTAVN